MTFKEIICDARIRKIGVVFTGIEANFLYLALQLFLQDDAFMKNYPLMENVLTDCEDSLAEAMGAHKFMDLEEIAKQADIMAKDFARKIVEETASKASVSRKHLATDGESGWESA